jgi:2-polyprenyl-6-methoxyphenol hydroxylase-like FAD-dependent oxidoreductase
MSWDETTNVLIVGAGPVGMMAALALANRGIKPMIIDAGNRISQHSFACALHARSLEILEGFDLWDDIMEWGHRIETIGFYDGVGRRAELDLVRVRQRHPFVVVLPQSALEWMMEKTLRDWAGIDILRNHQLTGLWQNESGVFATAGGPAPVSSAFPQDPATVQQSIVKIRAQALIGADGRDSAVRRLLGIPFDSLGADEHFALFEYDTDLLLDREIRVILDSSSTNVVWPIRERRCRWTLQVDPAAAEAIKATAGGGEHLAKMLETRVLDKAPWFKGRVKEVHWMSYSQFQRRLAARFAQGRCRLVGDAAHQTGPIGVQSMNLGLLEAVEVADDVVEMTTGLGPSDNGFSWSVRSRQQWLGLLGADGGALQAHVASDWLNQRAARLIPCLPASFDELPSFLGQLGASA